MDFGRPANAPPAGTRVAQRGMRLACGLWYVWQMQCKSAQWAHLQTICHTCGETCGGGGLRALRDRGDLHSEHVRRFSQTDLHLVLGLLEEISECACLEGCADPEPDLGHDVTALAAADASNRVKKHFFEAAFFGRVVTKVVAPRHGCLDCPTPLPPSQVNIANVSPNCVVSAPG